MNDEMEEIISEFITESEESLDKVEPMFVELEKKGQDADMLNEIFRSMHTIKGAAGFLNFQTIVDVSHSAENIMKKLREGEVTLSANLMDVLLKAIDMLRLLLTHLKSKDGIEEDVSPLVKEMDSALKSASGVSDSPDMTDQKQKHAKPVEIEELIKSYSETDQDTVSAENNTTDTGQETQSMELNEAKENQQKNEAHGQKLKDISSKNLRVDIERIDNVMNLAGEVVLVRNRLLNISSYLEQKYGSDDQVESLMESVSFLDRVTSDMQLAVMKIRMQPIKKVLSKFPRLVRDISSSVNKDVELEIIGQDTEVDKTVIENIGDPLTHILRNSIDHGIESPEERIKKKKSKKGKITINVCQRGNQIVIEISDDGKGIDLAKVKSKARDIGLITTDEAATMTSEAATDIIFMPGFTMKDVSSELSGRGVGMDVVKTNISQLNGYVQVITEKDVGTTFRLCIPLTLAIIQALMVEVSGIKYAIPLSPIEETMKVSKDDIESVSGQNVIVIRDKVYPLFNLNRLLRTSSDGLDNPDHMYLIVISLGDKRFCVAVDKLNGQEEVVIKNLKGVDTTSSHVLGATITGDGKVVFILDVTGMSMNLVGASSS